MTGSSKLNLLKEGSRGCSDLRFGPIPWAKIQLPGIWLLYPHPLQSGTSDLFPLMGIVWIALCLATLDSSASETRSRRWLMVKIDNSMLNKCLIKVKKLIKPYGLKVMTLIQSVLLSLIVLTWSSINRSAITLKNNLFIVSWEIKAAIIWIIPFQPSHSGTTHQTII